MTGMVRQGTRLAARAASLLLDLLMPPTCLACHARVGDQSGLCGSCWQRVHFLDQPCCPRCGQSYRDPGHAGLWCGACLQSPPPYDRARAVFRYDDASKGLVLAFKHADRPGWAGVFAPWMARAAGDLLGDADLLVPVPLHRWRLWHRRYNQAALLAQALARRSGKACRPDLLTRRRATRPQGTLDRGERQKNLAGAIGLVSPSLSLTGRRVLLVDDVLTTGATIGECATVLRRAGAASVDVVTLARVELPQ